MCVLKFMSTRLFWCRRASNGTHSLPFETQCHRHRPNTTTVAPARLAGSMRRPPPSLVPESWYSHPNNWKKKKEAGTLGKVHGLYKPTRFWNWVTKKNGDADTQMQAKPSEPTHAYALAQMACKTAPLMPARAELGSAVTAIVTGRRVSNAAICNVFNSIGSSSVITNAQTYTYRATLTTKRQHQWKKKSTPMEKNIKNLKTL